MESQASNADRRDAPLDAAAVMEEIRSGAIRTVIVGGCDTVGVFRTKRVSGERFARGADPMMNISEYMFGVDIADGLQSRPSGYEGWWPTFDTGLGDIDVVPDLATLRRVPWLEDTAMVLCDYRDPEGNDFEHSPRHVLKKVLRRYEEQGLEARLAPEFEFVVYRETEKSIAEKGFRNLEPLYSHATAYGSTRGTIDSHLIAKVVEELIAARVPVDVWNSEASPGQYELNIAHAPALEAADRGFFFKVGVKEICALEGFTATFMSKLTSASPGNSMHIHQSVWRDGEPVFYDANASNGVSQLMLNYIAGQVRTLIPFMPIFSPTPAAFKRPAPYMGPGISENWGGDNRMCAIRTLAADPGRCRVEHRQSGADANIYLVLAAMLAGGLHGIENELEPPEPTTGDAYAKAEGLRPIPKTIDEALGEFEENPVANEYLGEEFVRRYAATRRWEAELARKEITDWELERYLLRS